MHVTESLRLALTSSLAHTHCMHTARRAKKKSEEINDSN